MTLNQNPVDLVNTLQAVVCIDLFPHAALTLLYPTPTRGDGIVDHTSFCVGPGEVLQGCYLLPQLDTYLFIFLYELPLNLMR